MKKLLLTLLILTSQTFAQALDDGLPTLQRSFLPSEEMWQLETELVGHRDRNGAVQECVAAALRDLLQQGGYEPTVESLVRVLTRPTQSGTPESAIKELLLPRAGSIKVSQDASMAIISTPMPGGESLEIFRDTVSGLTVQRMQR